MESTDSSMLCDICDTPFTDKQALRHHKYEHHSIPNPISFQGGALTVERSENGIMNCPIPACDRSYQTRTSWSKHIASHQGNLPRGSTPVGLIEGSREG